MHSRFVVILLLIAGQAWGGDQPIVMTGSIGGGLFLPTGDDADVADLSLSIELNGSIAATGNWGFEAEFIYVPIQLEDATLATQAQRKSSQMTALTGLHFTTSQPGQGRPTAALSLRGGFSRVATVAKAYAPQGGWIGGTIDRIENPTASGSSTRTTDAALALSPRVAVLFPVSGMTSVELGLAPVFVFNRGAVSTQVHFGLRFSFSAPTTM